MLCFHHPDDKPTGVGAQLRAPQANPLGITRQDVCCRTITILRKYGRGGAFRMSGDVPRRKRWTFVRKLDRSEGPVTTARDKDWGVIAGGIGVLLLCSRSKGLGSIVASDKRL
jgi:hypothetical protein